MVKFITYPSGNVWTSSIGEVEIQATGNSVAVEISAGEAILFSNTYVPSSGLFVFYGLSGILEAYMRDNRLVSCSCSINATATDGEATAEFKAFYCSRTMRHTVDSWAASRFLTVANYAVLAPSSPLKLTIAASDSDGKYLIRGVYEDESGEKVPFSKEIDIAGTMQGELVCVTVDVSPSVVLSHIAAGQSEKKLLAYSVFAGKRSFSVFVDNTERESMFTFLFRNMFNAEETLRVCGVVDRDLAIERGEAVIGEKSVVYDVNATLSYGLTTAPMPRVEAAAIEQLQQSYDVRDIYGNALIVTDENYEYDTDMTTLKSVKLTWKYAADRVMDDTELPDSNGIFTKEFDNRFS